MSNKFEDFSVIKSLTIPDREKIDLYVECLDKYNSVMLSYANFDSSKTITSILENNQNILKGECSDKKIHAIDDNVREFKDIYLKISNFKSNPVCKDVFLESKVILEDIDATFMYYMSTIFPTDEALTTILHEKLAKDYFDNTELKNLFLASRAYLDVYVSKCKKQEDALVKKIQGHFAKIFDKDNNINPLGTVDDIIANNKCADTINKLTGNDNLKTLLSQKVDWDNIFFQVQKKDSDGDFEEMCMIFSSDHTKLENIDMIYEGYALGDSKTCSDIKRFVDPTNKSNKPFENKKVINLLSLSDESNAELFQDCGMSIGDTNGSLTGL